MPQVVTIQQHDLARDRAVIDRGGVLVAATEHITVQPHERVTVRRVRFRTVGDATCTGAVESEATTVGSILEELAVTRHSERHSRADDRRAEAAMEDRKREGYF